MSSINIRLYNPFPHQRMAHEVVMSRLRDYKVGDPRRHVTFNVNAMRQIGKSTFVGNELLRIGLSLPNLDSIYISPTFELAKKMLNDFSKALGGTTLVSSINKSDRIIILYNGHTIRLCSAEQGNNIRGLNVSGILVIDELEYIRRSFIDEVIAPFTDFHKAPTIGISTPRMKRGLHWEQQCMGRDPHSGVVAINWADYDLSYLHSEDFLAMKKRQLPERTFRTDYLGEFIDGESAIFGNIAKVVMAEGYKPQSNMLYWGIDWASGLSKDRTVLTAYNELNEQVYIKEWASESPMQQVREIASILMLNKEKTRKVTAEKNSMGEVYIDALNEALVDIYVTKFNTTNESKRRIIEDVVVLMEQGQMKLIYNDTQMAEFEYFESQILPSGVVRYSSPSTLHDDYVMATCLALSGRNSVNAWY